MKYAPFKSQVANDVKQYDKTQLAINPSYAASQPQILDLIDYYWMDKFRDGDQTKDGWKKAFYNIVRNPTYISQKMIDLDTKDIRITATEGVSYYPAWLYSRDLVLYMRMKMFGQKLNESVYNLPKYGSIVAKKVGSDVLFVPMSNLMMDQNVSKLRESMFVMEKHEMTPTELRKMTAWDQGEIEAAIKDAAGGRVCFYERFGEITGEKYNYWVGTEDGRIFTTETFDDIDELYRKCDWETIPGRMLGRGVPESLFEAQIHKNRVTNFKTEGLHWSSKHIFQTRDTTIQKNLMTNVDNGEVIIANSEITPLVNEERNLAAYNSEDQRWDKLIRDLSFSYAELAGERPPAGTPLGTSVLQSQQAGGYFDMRREELGMFWKGIILDWVIPSFKKEKYTQHQIMLGEFDDAEVSKIRDMFAVKHGNQNILRYIATNGVFPDFQQQELLKSVARDRVNRQKAITIPDAYYDDVKYKADVIITNEQLDVAARLTTIQTALQILASNPGIIENPRTRRLFYKALDLSGISPVDLGIDEASIPASMEQTMSSLRPGGSIARPQRNSPSVIETAQAI